MERLQLPIVTLLVVTLLSCEPEYAEPYERFVIPQGAHSSGIKAQSLQSNTLRFTAVFDESAIYQTQLTDNQYDINKLMGFADCNAHHHENSARFGWRWLDDQLEIHSYTYTDGARASTLLGTVPLNEPNAFEIAIEGNYYLFYLNHHLKEKVARGQTCNRGLYYMLFPYFGGDEAAPHDILIQAKTHY